MAECFARQLCRISSTFLSFMVVQVLLSGSIASTRAARPSNCSYPLQPESGRLSVYVDTSEFWQCINKLDTSRSSQYTSRWPPQYTVEESNASVGVACTHTVDVYKQLMILRTRDVSTAAASITLVKQRSIHTTGNMYDLEHSVSHSELDAGDLYCCAGSSKGRLSVLGCVRLIASSSLQTSTTPVATSMTTNSLSSSSVPTTVAVTNATSGSTTNDTSTTSILNGTATTDNTSYPTDSATTMSTISAGKATPSNDVMETTTTFPGETSPREPTPEMTTSPENETEANSSQYNAGASSCSDSQTWTIVVAVLAGLCAALILLNIYQWRLRTRKNKMTEVDSKTTLQSAAIQHA